MKRFLKVLGLGLGALLTLLLIVGATAYIIGGRRVARTHAYEPAPIAAVSDSAALARGAHLLNVYGCRDCHTADLGGQVLADAPPFRAVASNLTRGQGGVGARYTDADWDRSIRHGVKPDGRAVMIMPASIYHQLADTDLAALVAALKRVPPVDRTLPPSEVRPLGRLLAAGPIDPAAEVDLTPTAVAPPPIGPTAAYGAYLVGSSCVHCHGEDLAGVEQPPDPGSPPAPDLRAAASWPRDAFARALRTGVRPSGPPLDPRFMPWTSTRHMTDDEITAVHLHLGTLLPGGSRPAAGA